MREKEFVQSVICKRNSDAYIRYMVASWAGEFTLILTQKRLLHCSLCDNSSDLTMPTSNHMPDLAIFCYK